MKQAIIRMPGSFTWVPYAVTAVLITVFLFFIDEGYYNFRWMADPGSWVVFPFYAVPIFALQLLFSLVILRSYHGRGKILLSIAGGVLTTLVLVILFFFRFAG